jgi:hypothetical protein
MTKIDKPTCVVSLSSSILKFFGIGRGMDAVEMNVLYVLIPISLVMLFNNILFKQVLIKQCKTPRRWQEALQSSNSNFIYSKLRQHRYN